MKKKFLSVLFALVLVLSLSLVTAVPMAAGVVTSTFNVTTGTYTTTPTGDEPFQTGDIGASLTGTWSPNDVIGDFTASGTGSMYATGHHEESGYGTTVTVEASGTMSADEITFSGTAVRTSDDNITEDAFDSITGTVVITDGAIDVVLVGWDEAHTYTVDILMSGSVVGPVINVDTTESFFTIQAAIDDADTDTGDTISVAAGTYNERVNVNKSLTLEGANAGVPATEARGPESIINPQGLELDFGVLIDGTGTVATFDGFTVENYERAGILAGAFSLEDDPAVVHILNNIVKEPIGQHNNNCIQVADGTTGTVIGNEVMGANLESPDWSGSGILVSGSSNVLVSNNYVHDCEGGIQIQGYAEYRDAPAENNIVEYNLVEDNESGIVPQMNSIGTIIRYNDVLTNEGGIAVMAMDYSWEHSAPSGTEIHSNNIVGNVNYGVKSGVWGSDTGNVLAEEVDATNNWWGHSSGPSHSPGSGDKVSDYVDYEPWLLTEGGDPYDKTLALNPDWSIVSPDAELDNWHVVGSVGLVYAYDNGAFVEVVEPDPITPVFIKTTDGGGVGFNYAESSQGIFTTDLEAGWNLIGIPETDATARAILSPLRYGVNSEVALATLASQGNYNPSGESFYRSALANADWTSFLILDLYPFDGYWAYMNVDKEFGVIVVPDG